MPPLEPHDVPPIDVGSGIATTTAQTAAAQTRRLSLDRLRSLLGPAFGGATVTTDYGGPTWGTLAPHTGIDLVAAEGTPIQDPIGGTVERVWSDSIGGNQVAIKTPQGYREVFAHLAYIPAFIVNTPGAGVPQGGIIGYVGQTGMASGPHLHYEVAKPNGSIGTIGGTVDPLAFIGEFASAASAGTPGKYTEPGGGVGTNPRPPKSSSSSACANVPQSVIDDINNTLGPKGVIGALFGSDAAAGLRRTYPDVPLACLREIAYGAGADVAKPSAIESLALSVGRLTGDLTDPQTWARVGLTLAAVALIGTGVILYAGSAVPKPTVI